MDETQQKNQKKASALQALTQWHAERGKQTEQRKANNVLLEQSQAKEAEAVKSSSNPWQRVCHNVEFKNGTTESGKDLSRMKQSMLARKNDLTQAQKQPSML